MEGLFDLTDLLVGGLRAGVGGDGQPGFAVGHVEGDEVGVTAGDGGQVFEAADVVDAEPAPLPGLGVGGVTSLGVTTKQG